jgi:hypothetical protein
MMTSKKWAFAHCIKAWNDGAMVRAFHLLLTAVEGLLVKAHPGAFTSINKETGTIGP